MPWITLDNLKRFWKGLRTTPITFTGEIDLQNTTRYKGNEIATKADVEAGEPDLTQYMKKTADSNLIMGDYGLLFPATTISVKTFNQVPMLTIKHTGRGVNVDGNLMVKNVFVATIDDVRTAIPTKVSQFTNDSGYATKTELENGFTTASLTVSGETSVPTPATTNNSNTVANTEFVHGVVNDLVNGAPTALDTLQELATALGNDPNFSTTILNKIGEKESKTDAQIEYKKLQDGVDACYTKDETMSAKDTKQLIYNTVSTAAQKIENEIPTKVSQLTDDVGIAKISNGHLILNGSELWVE